MQKSVRMPPRLVTPAAPASPMRIPEWQQIIDLTETLTLALMRWHQRRKSVRALQALSDWQLKDLGVPRGDIPVLVDRQLHAGSCPSADTIRLVTTVTNARHSTVKKDQPKIAA